MPRPRLPETNARPWLRKLSAAAMAFAMAFCLPASALRAGDGASPQTVSPQAASAHAPADDPEHVMDLPLALRTRLQAEVIDGATSEGERFERLIRFVRDPQGLAIRYRDDATQSVATAYDTREANCVTFTLIFLALAKAAGIEAQPQRVRRILSWHQDGNTLYLSGHVIARAKVGTRDYTVDFTGNTVVARDPPETIGERELLAHYYNNQAMDLLMREDMAAAQRLMSIALALDPTYASHWSNAGVIHVRAGDIAAANRAYAEALARDPEETGALFNSIGLAQRSGDRKRADVLQRRLDRVQARDPFHHFLRGMTLEREGRDSEAIAHYRKAIVLHPDEPRFYAALARAHAQHGDIRSAGRALRRAIALSKGIAREDYQSRLQALQQGSKRTAQ
jgi:tetratricopeptide (TPR) repeat protein